MTLEPKSPPKSPKNPQSANGAKMLDWWQTQKVRRQQKKMMKRAKEVAVKDPEFVLGRDFVIETQDRNLRALGRLEQNRQGVSVSPPSVIRFLNLPKLKKTKKEAQEPVLHYKITQCSFLFGLDDEVPIETIFGQGNNPFKHSELPVNNESEDVDDAARVEVKSLLGKSGKHAEAQKRCRSGSVTAKPAALEGSKHSLVSPMEISAWVGKTEALDELIAYVKERKERPIFSDEVLESLIKMIFVNMLRPLPPQQPVAPYDRKENHFIHHPTHQWHQLLKVYSLFFEILECNGAYVDVGQDSPFILKCAKLVKADYINRMIGVLETQDRRERVLMKQAITLVYDTFLSVRGEFLLGCVGAINAFLEDPCMRTTNTAGTQIHSVLQVVRYILEQLRKEDLGEERAVCEGSVNYPRTSPFALLQPLTLIKALVSLYKAPAGMLSRYINQLLRCLHVCFQLVPRLMVPTVRLLLRYWPRQNAVKELLFLHQTDEIIVALAPVELKPLGPSKLDWLRPLLPKMVHQLGEAMLSQHYEVITSAIKILDNNPPFFFMIAKERSLLPRLYKSLCLIVPRHPDPSVLFVTSMLLKHIASTARSHEERKNFDDIKRQTQEELANALNTGSGRKRSRSEHEWEELEQQLFARRLAAIQTKIGSGALASAPASPVTPENSDLSPSLEKIPESDNDDGSDNEEGTVSHMEAALMVTVPTRALGEDPISSPMSDRSPNSEQSARPSVDVEEEGPPPRKDGTGAPAECKNEADQEPLAQEQARQAGGLVSVTEAVVLRSPPSRYREFHWDDDDGVQDLLDRLQQKTGEAGGDGDDADEPSLPELQELAGRGGSHEATPQPVLRRLRSGGAAGSGTGTGIARVQNAFDQEPTQLPPEHLRTTSE